MSAPGDLLHRFLFEHLPVRGHLVRLDASWRAAIEHHDYPETVAAALGEAMAAASLMAGALKFEGRLSLQFEGPGPVRLMLAQCTHRHAIRGVARHDGLPAGGALVLNLGLIDHFLRAIGRAVIHEHDIHFLDARGGDDFFAALGNRPVSGDCQRAWFGANSSARHQQRLAKTGSRRNCCADIRQTRRRRIHRPV